MIQIRKGDTRGHFDHGWLETWHTFSFADYFDPAHHHFRSLRVINEDIVAPGKGFGTHPHRDMEILTWILSGSLEHKDSIGNGAVIRPGDVQIMSAGTGVLHSEFNPDQGTPVHLLQIWLLPAHRNLTPRYDQRFVEPAELQDRLLCVAAPPGQPAVVPIHQDARIHIGRLGSGVAVEHTFAPGRSGYLQVARGEVQLEGEWLRAGDGAALTDPGTIRLKGQVRRHLFEPPSELVLFDLA